MSHTRALCTLLVGVLGACGPGGRDTQTDDDTPHADVGQDDDDDDDESKEDPWNCGEIGAKCIGHLGIGECVDGQCGATLGECYGPPGDCNSICAFDGRPCAELACDGATAWVWNASTQYEANVLCAIGDRETVTPLHVACDEPLDGLANSALCCCS